MSPSIAEVPEASLQPLVVEVLGNL
jgi:hypothetical protein